MFVAQWPIKVPDAKVSVLMIALPPWRGGGTTLYLVVYAHYDPDTDSMPGDSWPIWEGP